jgi:hypothetical protein
MPAKSEKQLRLIWAKEKLVFIILTIISLLIKFGIN